MDNIEINIGGVDLVFKVEFEHDTDAGAPWENSDGHGDVSEWTTRGKRAGELVLSNDRGSKRYYDFAGACRTALRDGWDTHPYNTDGKETKRQQAAKAARANYEYLQEWCTDRWRYVGVIVTLLDTDCNDTEVTASLWGVEDRNDYHETVAQELTDELVREFGISWDVITKSTYGYT